MLDGASVLLTGGTGSFGKAFIAHALAELDPAKVIVLSRDELKQYEARKRFGDDPRLRWFIGDVRDRRRLERAMRGVDYVVHAAALKQVDTGEYNAFEFVQTNVHGSQNVIEAAIDCGVKRVVALSTDKASSPINLYGATKLCADGMFISANHYAAGHPTRFAVVRYGNVMGSRGSVIPYFRELAGRGEPLPITDARMTRFWITLPQAVRFVVDSFGQMRGGELYVPRIPSMRLIDLARVIAPDSPTREIGVRPGLLDRARRFRDHGLVRDPAAQRHPGEGGWHQEVHEFGLSYRLPDVLCALGSSQLKRLASFKARRSAIVERYRAGLADVAGLRLPVRHPDADPMWHLYAVRVLDGRRRALYDHLRGHGIGVQVNYLPVYWHPVFEDLGHRRGECPVAERFYAEELSLPLFPDLTDADVDRVVSAIRDFFPS